MPETVVNTGAADGATSQSQSGAGAAGAAGSAGAGTQDTGGAAASAGAGSGAASGTGTAGADTGASAGGQPAGVETKTGDAAGGAAAAGATGTTAAADAAKTVTPTWPADWRQQMAGEDKDYVKTLERFASPQDLIKKLKEQDKLISSGQLKQPLPKDATPEQLAAYRKENGIPEAADKYDLTLPNGLTVGEKDKPIVGHMLEAMHKDNLTNAQVQNILASYYEKQKSFMVEREKQAVAMKTQTEDTLRKEWGDEYRGEINRVENLLNTYSRETQEALQFGVDQNGMPLLNNPAVLRDLALQSRIINPVSTVVSGGGTNQMSSVETEIAAIEARFSGTKEESDKYYKDVPAQARLRELYEWRETQKVRK